MNCIYILTAYDYDGKNILQAYYNEDDVKKVVEDGNRKIHILTAYDDEIQKIESDVYDFLIYDNITKEVYTDLDFRHLMRCLITKNINKEIADLYYDKDRDVLSYNYERLEIV